MEIDVRSIAQELIEHVEYLLDDSSPEGARDKKAILTGIELLYDALVFEAERMEASRGNPT